MDYKILNIFYKGNKQYYLIECQVCGHQKEILVYNYKKAILKHDGTNCQDDYYNYFIGKQFDDYIVDERDGLQYKMHCLRCGTTASVSLRTLQLFHSGKYNHGEWCFKNLPDSEIKTLILYRFQNMKQRCENPNNIAYTHYGGRGIKLEYEYPIDLYLDFCDELKEYSQKYGLRNSTFDRIDVNGNYCKSNLRIANQNIQSTNTTRKKIFILQKDKEKVICDNSMEFGRHFGVNGRSVGNVVRSSSKTAGGWKLVRLISPDEDINKIIKEESITTNLITT